MRPLINTLHPDDYKDFEPQTAELRSITDLFHSKDVNVCIAHEHRFWEYSTVLMLWDMYCNNCSKPNANYMDVGSGHGLMGPAMSYLRNVDVTECEPSDYEHRNYTNAILQTFGKKQLRIIPCSTDNLPDEQFDMVSCISVIEHMPAEVEQRCWKQLVDRIKPNGVFFADVDCVPDPNKAYVYDNLRAHNFTVPELKDRVDHLLTLGMKLINEPDYTWNGSLVHDFTFFRICMVKE